MRGNAADVIEARRQHLLNDAQTRIAKWIFPVNLLALIGCISCAYYIFTIDRKLALESGKSLYYAGVSLQGYFIYIVMRDTTLTLSHFVRGHQQGFLIVILAHYFMSCLDNLLLTGLAIWGTVAVNRLEATQYAAQEVTSGLPTFVTVTTINIVVAYLYVCAHICAFPITICCIARDPERFVANLRDPEELNDDDLDLLDN